jgi:multiple sugar transport system permease protein
MILRRALDAAFTYLVLGLILVLVLGPFVFMAMASLKTNLDILQSPPNLHIFNWEVIKRNYQEVLYGRSFLLYLRNSMVVVAGSTLLALMIGTPAGYAFSRFRFRGKNDLAFWILSNRFMPVVAVAVPVYLMMLNLKLLNTYPGLILPYVAVNMPLVVWVMRGFFDEISHEIDEAALIDGCGRWSALWRVLLPLSGPGLVTTAILCAIFTWNEFLLGLFIVTTGATQTVPIGASGLLTMERSIEWNVTATVGVVTVIPVLIFSLLIQRHIVRGLTAGAVK